MSADGREASRGQPAPPRAEVRWYRAARASRGGASPAAASAGQPLPPPPPRLKSYVSARAAVGAYVATMRAAA